ncbi:MAG: hypothetical protein PHI44_03585 [Candidatus Ratteibacteria bacterium]|nr:hypothetical protein [Candidatus Ratteibacteria bacterium]
MIDYGAGFFLGLKFGAILIILAVEFYFCVFNRYIDKEIESSELFVLGLITALCILFSLPFSHFSIGFWAVLPLPIAYLVFRILENRGIELEFRSRIEKKLKVLKENAKRNPHRSEILIEIGDIYFTQRKYDEALSYYYRARSIKETPEIAHKIKIAERESKIQKGEIWICGECGTTNPGNSDECIECGNSNNPILSIKQDIARHKEEIKRWIIYGFGIPIVCVLVIVILKSILPGTAFTFVAICISLLVIYILWRTFWTSL